LAFLYWQQLELFMHTCITNGIKINVVSKYEPQHSSIAESRFVFSYRIEIINESDYTVQLLRRHWFIIDSNSNKRDVKGDGVVGEQPVLRPGDAHRYTSWCPFNSEIGLMKGYFTMIREIDEQLIDVTVPEFTMIASQRMN